MNERHIKLTWDLVACIVGITLLAGIAGELLNMHALSVERGLAIIVVAISLLYVCKKSMLIGVFSIIGACTLFITTYIPDAEIIRDITLLILGFMMINVSASDIRMEHIEREEDV